MKLTQQESATFAKEVPSQTLEKRVQTLGRNYGITWNWLYNHFDGVMAQDVLYGQQNLYVPHEVLINLPSPAYVVSLYIGANKMKRAIEANHVPEFKDADELYAKLVHLGRVPQLTSDYEKIYSNIKTTLLHIAVEQKNRVLESMKEPYVSPYYPGIDGPTFLDKGEYARDPRIARLRQFWANLKTKYDTNQHGHAKV